MFPWSSSPAWSHTSPPPATAPTWPPTSLPMTTSSRPTFEWPTTPSPPTHPTPHAGYSMDPHHHSMPPSAPSAPTSSSADHLFGHASTLHSTWPCTPSIPPTTSSSSPPTFSSLANSSPILQHHTFPPTPTTARIDVPTYPTPTMNFVAHTGPIVFWLWRTLSCPCSCSTLFSDLPDIADYTPTPQPAIPPQQTPPTTTTQSPPPPKHTAVKAAPKMRTDKRPDKPRRAAQAPVPTPKESADPAPTVPPTVQQDLASVGTTAKELAESVRLIQAQQQLIMHGIPTPSRSSTTTAPTEPTSDYSLDTTTDHCAPAALSPTS